jgi:hypothetical protein
MTSPQDLDDRVENPTTFDTILDKLDKIARLQHKHTKRLDDQSDRDIRVPGRLHQIDKSLDRINSRLDLIEDAQRGHGERLEEIVGLLRTE